MEPHVIVMIVSLLIPNGENELRVTQFQSVEKCLKAASIEATDPFVQRVECAELEKGVLTLRFGSRQQVKSSDLL